MKFLEQVFHPGNFSGSWITTCKININDTQYNDEYCQQKNFGFDFASCTLHVYKTQSFADNNGQVFTQQHSLIKEFDFPIHSFKNTR